ncbi:MAG TPA: hypothetical protein P5572_07555 [Phycisphaerae bacterium]|nr:hypothetical protein [Phycisphaerales bacterium]HRX84857.1 hypothetical protein [Phycisphaerae bacterium]
MNKKSVGMLAVLGGLLIVSSARAGEVIAPGTVIFDMDTHTEFCDPDFWSFFGYPTVDFGSNGADSEDGTAVFTSGDWTSCDLVYGPSACQFLGAKHGGGRLCCGQPLCGGLGSGVRDADDDLSLGTGVTMRIRLILVDDAQPGVRPQFQLTDTNGLETLDTDTVAVVPRSIPGKPWINRTPPLAGDGLWHTYTFWFNGLDRSYDASAVAGVDPLNLTDVNSYKLIFRRGPTTSGNNKIVFDKITLIDDAPVLWADEDGDNDVDLDDYGRFQACFGQDPATNAACARFDANYDGAIDIVDLQNFHECLEGPDVETGFFPWCY